MPVRTVFLKTPFRDYPARPPLVLLQIKPLMVSVVHHCLKDSTVGVCPQASDAPTHELLIPTRVLQRAAQRVSRNRRPTSVALYFSQLLA